MSGHEFAFALFLFMAASTIAILLFDAVKNWWNRR